MEIGTFEEYRRFKGSIECEEGRMFGFVYGTGEKYEVKGDNNSNTLIALHEEYKKTIDAYIEKLIAIEMAKPQLKIVIDWALYTDGDYRLDNAEEYGCKDDEREWGHYSGKQTYVMSEDKGCRREAVSFLEKLLCDIRVGYTHYYLIKDMYEMFEKAMRFIGNKENYGAEYFYMGGNYDGTELSIKITRAEEEGSEK